MYQFRQFTMYQLKKCIPTMFTVFKLCKIFQVVIADNDSAVLVFIRKSDLLPMLCEDILNKAKLVISRFQMENGYINTDECTCIEYDTEVYNRLFSLMCIIISLECVHSITSF